MICLLHQQGNRQMIGGHKFHRKIGFRLTGVVSQFILQNTGIFWSDYSTGEIPDPIKQSDNEWSIRCPLYASENLGVWGEAPINQ